MERSHIRVPHAAPLSRAGKLSLLLGGATLGPPTALLAAARGVPGLRWHLHAYRVALRVAARDPRALGRPLLQRLVLFPMDSTRYFEFDCIGRWLASIRCERYLDVSSPRLLPLVQLLLRPEIQADLLNPSAADLEETHYLLERLGVPGRWRLHDATIDALPEEAGAFDVITSVSVVEHIPQDAQAIQAMWHRLRPGGRLLITVPCARTASEQYIDRNYYGVLPTGEDEFFFWQRFYDEPLLRERFFPVTGPPARIAVYGEKVAGFLQRNMDRKRADAAYPLWREPLVMANAFRYYDRIDDLPGEGVAALEFVKPAAR